MLLESTSVEGVNWLEPVGNEGEQLDTRHEDAGSSLQTRPWQPLGQPVKNASRS